MKRIIAVLLTLMMALSLTACSGDDNAQVAGTWLLHRRRFLNV